MEKRSRQEGKKATVETKGDGGKFKRPLGKSWDKDDLGSGFNFKEICAKGPTAGTEAIRICREEGTDM